MDTIDTNLSDLATRYPAASRLFHEHRLDYCCGGKRSLADACRERQIDATDLLRRIQVASTSVPLPAWASVPLPDIVLHVIRVYHGPLHAELDELRAMAAKVESVHRDKASCPRGLSTHLQALSTTLAEHMRSEEEVLFPAIVEGRGNRAGASVAALEDEHRDVGRALEATRGLTTDFKPPSEACTTWRALYLRLEELERSLMEHIHIENNILFPRALRETAEVAQV